MGELVNDWAKCAVVRIRPFEAKENALATLAPIDLEEMICCKDTAETSIPFQTVRLANSNAVVELDILLFGLISTPKILVITCM